MAKKEVFNMFPRMVLARLRPDLQLLPFRCVSSSNQLSASKKQSQEGSSNINPNIEREERIDDAQIGDIYDRPKLKNPKVSARPLNFEEARDLAAKAVGNQKKFLEEKIESIKIIFGGQSDAPRTPNEEWYYKRVSFWMKRYENFVGLTEVKAAQARVVECERKFIDTQEMRREAQVKIADIQKRVKDIHMELEKTHRGEDRYLVLVTQEHQVLKEERNLQEEFKFHEKSERECFSSLSNAVRDSHEKERAQAEKTKYWSVLGSIIGTCIGIFGTTINNRLRMNELRRLVSQNSSVEEIRGIGSELKEDFSSHRSNLQTLVNEIQCVVEDAGNSFKHMDEMKSLFDILKDSSDKINTRVLDETLDQLKNQQELLSNLICEHKDKLDLKLEELHGDMYSQNKNISQLTHISLKDKERDLKTFEKRESDWIGRIEVLTRQNEALKEVVDINTKSIDEKMKDVRSLLLAQSQLPRETDKWTDKLDRNERKLLVIMQDGFDILNKKLDEASKARSQALAAINNRINQNHDEHGNPELQLLQLDSVNVLLDNHQKRTQRVVMMSALLVGIFTPILMYSIGKLV